jgi:hypothetical protein
MRHGDNTLGRGRTQISTKHVSNGLLIPVRDDIGADRLEETDKCKHAESGGSGEPHRTLRAPDTLVATYLVPGAYCSAFLLGLTSLFFELFRQQRTWFNRLTPSGCNQFCAIAKAPHIARSFPPAW